VRTPIRKLHLAAILGLWAALMSAGHSPDLQAQQPKVGQPSQAKDKGPSLLDMLNDALAAQLKRKTAADDESAAHALYDQMIATMRNAKSLSYVSHYMWETKRDPKGDKKIGECTYRAWLKKPNYFRVEAESAEPAESAEKTKSASAGKATAKKSGGTLIGDGDNLWIYWLQGRPRWYGAGGPLEDDKTYEKTRFTSYMKKPAPPHRHSIGHETGELGAGMAMPILDPSTFHGYTDSLQPYLDSVKSRGTEKVAGEECDKIELSIMKHQRSWLLWLSKRDHLPRKLDQVIRVSYDIVVHEEWSSVALDVEIPDTLFAWKPPEDWTQWRQPEPDDLLLKPGTTAPEFALASADGRRIKLSDYRRQVVWLYIWRAG